MDSIKEYLDAIAHEKKRLVEALNQNLTFSSEAESLENIVTKGINSFGDVVKDTEPANISKIVLSPDATYFTSKDASINIAAAGTGKIFVSVGEKAYSLELEQEKLKTLTIPNNSGTVQTYLLSCAEVETLDLRNNGILSFSLGENDKITKLILCDNNITSFSPTSNKQIQFLHIFNNPICDEQAYENELKNLLLSLPDRSKKTIGSIVMHPWTGLEILVCYNDEGAIVKYPKNYLQPKFQLEPGVLYGLVRLDNNNKEYITYCNWNGAELTFNGDEVTALNRYHTLRKKWELEFSLAKNWMFGSAILYTEDEKDFHYHLRKVGVADVWDTAEKGFGMCFGVIDVNCGWIDGWQNMNVEDYYGYFTFREEGQASAEAPTTVIYLGQNGVRKYEQGCEVVQNSRHPMEKTEYSIYLSENPDTLFHHGDFVLSYLVGRGKGLPYGACPNAKILPVLYKTYDGTTNGSDLANFVYTLSSKCNSITCSFGNTMSTLGEYFSYARNELGSFGLSNVVTVSGSNSGTGEEWEYTKSYYDQIFGDFTIDGVVYHSSSYYCGSLDPSKTPSTINHSATALYDEKVSTSQNLKRDYLIGYGPTVGCRTSMNKDTGAITAASRTANGTSYSTPNCCATLALMRVIYSKMHPEENNFGKDSSFMNYVRNKWIDPLNYHMTFSVGMGLPSFLNETFGQTQLIEDKEEFTQNIAVQIGEEFLLRNTLESNQKNGYCLELDSKVLAKTKENTYFLLREPEGPISGYSLSSTPKKVISDDEVTAYNKVSASLLSLGNSTQPVLSQGKISLTQKAYEHIKEDDTIYDDGFLAPVFQENLGENFTIQLILDFAKALENANLIEAESSLGLVDILTFPQEQFEAIALRLTGLAYDEQTAKFVLNDAIVPATEKTSCTRFNYSAPTQLTYSVFGPPTRKFSIKNNSKGVLTVACDKDAVTVYYNGTLIFEQPIWLATIRAEKMGYNPNCLVDSDENILIYDRKLSQREVISNTIALLDNLEGV